MTATILLKINDDRAGKEFKQHKCGDAGLDLEVWNPSHYANGYYVPREGFAVLECGFSIKMDDESFGVIFPRSSTHMKRHLLVMSSVIDSGYTGPLTVNVYNPSPVQVFIPNGDRIAQLIPMVMFSEYIIKHVTKMPDTERGEGGFGHTGGFNHDRP